MVAAASVYATHRSTAVKLDFMFGNSPWDSGAVAAAHRPTQRVGKRMVSCVRRHRGAVGALGARYENRTPGGLGAPYENRTSGAASPPPPPQRRMPPRRVKKLDRYGTAYCTRGASAQPRTAKVTVTVPVRGKEESLSVPVQYRYRLPRCLFIGTSCKTGKNRSPEL
jgi:hypothetical protein